MSIKFCTLKSDDLVSMLFKFEQVTFRQVTGEQVLLIESVKQVLLSEPMRQVISEQGKLIISYNRC